MNQWKIYISLSSFALARYEIWNRLDDWFDCPERTFGPDLIFPSFRYIEFRLQARSQIFHCMERYERLRRRRNDIVLFSRSLQNRNLVKDTHIRQKHVDNRLALLVNVTRIDSIWPSCENLRLARSETVPEYSCWDMLRNGFGGILGNFTFLCDDFGHLFDSYFAWSKVRLFLIHFAKCWCSRET